MPISDKLIDQLLEGSSSREDILGEDGLLKELSKTGQTKLNVIRWAILKLAEEMQEGTKKAQKKRLSALFLVAKRST